MTAPPEGWPAMNYLSVPEARELGGLRLVLSVGVPGPWGEAAKSLFYVKGVPYAAVAQFPGADNEELVAWTGRANAPVAVFDREGPRSGWTEILFLAEKLAPKPRLIPEDTAERAWMFGLAHEICGEGGLGWSRRLMMIDSLLSPESGGAFRRAGEVLGERYGYSKEAAAGAAQRVAAVLDLLAGQLRRQRERGHGFLVGSSLSAVDIYWATFAAMLRPLPGDLCPMPDYLRGWYEATGPVVDAALDPDLMHHREMVYRNYLELPLKF